MPDAYWSSTTYEFSPAGVYLAYLGNGNVLPAAKTGKLTVWPVRSAAR